MINDTLVGQYLADENKQEPSFRFKRKNSAIFQQELSEVDWADQSARSNREGKDLGAGKNGSNSQANIIGTLQKRKQGQGEMHSSSSKTLVKPSINIISEKPANSEDDLIQLSQRSSLIPNQSEIKPFLGIPKSTSPNNPKFFNTRKSLDGTQSGLVYASRSRQLHKEHQQFIFDLSDVDMRLYRSIEYEALGHSKKHLFRDVWAMMKGSNVVDVFEVDPNIFSNFISEAYKYYQKHHNTFHNFKHGVTVMNTAYHFLKEGNLSLYFDSLSVAALMFASLMHDIGHTGHSNRFEDNSRSQLAIVYNDTSILEMHHASLAFKILLHEDNNIFKTMDKDDYFIFRKYVIKGILSTDIKYHVSDREKLQSKIDSTSFKPYATSTDISDFLLLFGVLVHCADLYTPTKNYPWSLEWARLLNIEFVNQVKKEQALGLPVTPWYAKLSDPTEMAKSEKSFISKVVRPLWCEVDRFFEGRLSKHLENLDRNYNSWDLIEKGTMSADGVKIPMGSSDEEESEESSDTQSRGGRTIVEEYSETGTIA